VRDTRINKLFELSAKDPKIFLIIGDLGFGALGEFEKKYPKQYLNAVEFFSTVATTKPSQ